MNAALFARLVVPLYARPPSDNRFQPDQDNFDMRCFINAGRWVALVLAVQFTFATLALAADAIPAERRLPRDVVAYVSFRNAAEFRTQWALTRGGKLLNDDSMADFRAASMEKVNQVSAIITEHLGLGLTELVEIPHGEFAASLAVLPDGKLSGSALLDFGDKEEAVRKLLDKLNEKSTEQGLEKSEEEFEDTKLTIYKKPAPAAGQPAMDAVAWFIKDSYLVVGNTPQTLKSILTRWDGSHDGVLAENQVFRYVSDACRDSSQEASPLLNWFMDPLGITRAAVAAQPQNAMQAGMFLSLLPAIGLDKFKGIGGSFDMARGDYDTVSRMIVYMEPPVKGVLNAFQFNPGSQVPPRWVTADAESYFTIHWSIDRAYLAIEGLVDSFQGAGALARLLQQFSENEETGNIHVKKDLIDLLSGKVHVVGAPTPEDDETDRFLVALEVKNAGNARKTLRKLAQIQGVQFKEREFQGETLYEFEMPDTGDDEPTSAGIVIAENHLMFANDVKLLEQVLRGSEGRETLADSAEYKRIAARFPEKIVGSSFTRSNDPLQGIRALHGNPFLMNSPLLAGDGDSLTDKLPSSDVVKKFSAPSGSYVQPDERGLKIISFSLKQGE